MLACIKNLSLKEIEAFMFIQLLNASLKPRCWQSLSVQADRQHDEARNGPTHSGSTRSPSVRDDLWIKIGDTKYSALSEEMF